jgi:integrase
LFATSKAVLSLDTLSRRVTELAAEMTGPPFLFRDLRRTAETEMAAIGFSVDLRAQLLSHGLGGVQSLHYDKHSYLPEKQAALAAWERHLAGQEQPATGATVVSIATRRRVA